MLGVAPATLTRRPGPAGAAAAQGAAAGTVLLCTYPALVSNAPHRSYPLAPLCSLRCSVLLCAPFPALVELRWQRCPSLVALALHPGPMCC